MKKKRKKKRKNVLFALKMHDLMNVLLDRNFVCTEITLIYEIKLKDNECQISFFPSQILMHERKFKECAVISKTMI